MQADNAFLKAYKGLNTEQRDAVDSIEGPVMVIAGPGTGKTTVLSLRIANILRKTDTPPESILAITYTDSGVRAMRAKLQSLIGERAHDIHVHTFHGFASFVIRTHNDHFPHLEGTSELSEIEAREIIQTILKDSRFRMLRPFGNADFYLDPILQAISSLKREAWKPKELSAFATREIKRIKSDDESISTRGQSKGKLKAEAEKRIEKCEKTILLAEVFEAYEERKRREKKIDYDDLISELLSALNSDELLLRLLQEQFLYIHIDEHQDTNDSQNAIVGKLAAFFDTPNVFIVGDEKQAIYRFQGASVENFLRFQKLWNDVRLIQLKHNYRSNQHLLDASFSMIEQNYAEGEFSELRVRLLSSKKEKQPIDVVTAENLGDSDAFLAATIEETLREDKSASIAVIVRTNREISRLKRVFKSYGIEAAADQSIDIFEHPAGMIFFELLRFLVDPSRTDALAKTISAGLWRLPFEERTTLVRMLKSGMIEKMTTKLPGLHKLRDITLSNDGIHALHEVAEVSGYTAVVSRNPEYVEVWRGIHAFAEHIIRERKKTDVLGLFEALIAYKDAGIKKRITAASGDVDAPVKILTAHGSKGLEFDYVVIPNATDSSWIGEPRKSFFVLPFADEGNENIRDARRLFYVALTRAKKHVTIVRSMLREGGEIAEPLRFLAELDPKDVREITVPLGKELRTVPEERFLKSEEHALAKRVISENGLSVTALNHFLDCPSLFFYRSILKLPEEPAALAEQGSALHAGFAEVWKSDNKSPKNIQKILEQSVKNYFDSSLLEASKKRAIEASLKEKIPVMTALLLPHWNSTGTPFIESWAEREFAVKVGPKKIDIRLHGKLDLVLLKDDGVYVYDYKSREGMSVAEIKGETKNSDGNYFRQLVFYSMLLKGHPKFKGKPVYTSLVFVMPDKKGRCVIQTLEPTRADIAKVEKEIEALVQSVWSGEFLKKTCEDEKCVWCRLKALHG